VFGFSPNPRPTLLRKDLMLLLCLETLLACLGSFANKGLLTFSLASCGEPKLLSWLSKPSGVYAS
jgi:hypothetical protein